MNKILISPYSKKMRNGKENPKNYPFFQEVIDKLKQKEFYIIQIGKADEKRFENIDEFLVNKSLKEITNLLNEVFCWISVDNFLQHLANLINKPGIVIWGQSDPEIFGHKIHKNLLKDRKYLRPRQFATWEETIFSSEVFVDSDVVIENILNNKEVSKESITKPLKLNLACGDIIVPEWINIDLYNPKADLKCDVKKLPYEDNTIDEIWASHIIEHFHYYEVFDVLKEWYRVLKVGGRIFLETPDMLASCKLFVEGNEQDRINLYGHFFAQPWLGDGQVHKFLFTETQLKWTLEQCGFKNIVRKPALRYIGQESRNLGIECYK